MRRYAAKDRAEILAEHLEEQFTLHPTSDSHPVIIHHEEVERRVREFLSAPIPPLPGDYYVSPTETVRTILRTPKRCGCSQRNTPLADKEELVEGGGGGGGIFLKSHPILRPKAIVRQLPYLVLWSSAAAGALRLQGNYSNPSTNYYIGNRDPNR
ncbi:hypothetical protein EVAR_46975_1 [Eumeta japonica]|uniref:Uncharacterized protein n=1 Tax=Eumeta variegata TaxID=151549 RepID=A0A4C1X992_EUMVA|nr:hypothetical protein EVAR_46975_1 [Eumeta japonica]